MSARRVLPRARYIAGCPSAGCLTHTTFPSGSWILMSQPTVGISHFGKMILPPFATTAAATDPVTDPELAGCGCALSV